MSGGDQLWASRLDATTLALKRTHEVFTKIHSNPIIDYDLPPKASLAGTILKHVYRSIEKQRNKTWPMTFKVGVTHDPIFRYTNPLFGYTLDKPAWDGMRVVFCTHDPAAASFTEAAAIQKFMGNSPANYV